MKYIESPNAYEWQPGEKSIFLAGGITGCWDWQANMRFYLRDTDLVLLNPRRADFPIHDPNASYAQIEWEHNHLRAADAIMFWFPHETLCPIVLYELGAWSMTDKKLFIGAHPQYQRRQDVVIQTTLVRDDIEHIYADLANMAGAIRMWAAQPAPAPASPSAQEDAR